MLTVHAVRSLKDLEPHVAAWDTLTQAAPRSLALRSGTWVSSWIEHMLPRHTSFCVALAFESEQLVGVLPLRSGRNGVRGLLAPLLRSTTDEHTFLGGPVMAEGPSRPAILAALLQQHLAVQPRTAAFHLERVWHVPEAAQTPPAPSGWQRLPRSSHVTGCLFDTRGTYEDRWTALGARTKKNLRNAENRLGRMGTLTHESLTGPDQADRGLEAFLMLEATGWKGSQRSAILQNHRLVNFYRHLVRRLAANGWLRIHLLRLDGRPVAAELCALVGGRLQVHKLAYDEQLEQVSPGHVLWRHTMEMAHSHPGIQEVDTLYLDAIRQRWDGQAYEYQDIWWLRRRPLPWLLRTLPLKLRDRLARKKHPLAAAATTTAASAEPEA